ncbi:4146_t:CDS:1, partial [Funneliformis geosporum]
SELKKKKIQRILEMLPSLDVLQLRHPEIYDLSWLCIRCNIMHEDFNHIWTCASVYQDMLNIINLLKFYLKEITQVDNFTPLLDHLFVWPPPLFSSFSFVDIIKGVVPSELYSFINSQFTSNESTMAAVSDVMHFVFTHTQKIWTDR